MNSTIQARYPQHSIIKGGILAKRGRGQFIKPWSLRTIIIDQNKQLFYYDREVLKGNVDLEGTTIRYLPPTEADGRENAFEIMNISNVKATQDRSLILAATSLKEAEEWVDVLMNSATVSSSSKIFMAEYESLQVFQFMLFLYCNHFVTSISSFLSTVLK